MAEIVTVSPSSRNELSLAGESDRLGAVPAALEKASELSGPGHSQCLMQRGRRRATGAVDGHVRQHLGGDQYMSR